MDDRSSSPRIVEVGHRRVLLLALPMTLSHVTTPLLGLVGATVIGRLGEAPLLGAVALGAVIFDFLFWTFGALRMATAGLTAQATGAGSGREVDLTVARALAVAILVGLVMIAGQNLLGLAAFRIAGASEAVTEALGTYFFVRIWSAPFTLANYAVLGSVLGRGRTDVGLLLQVAINAVNIALTLAFVLALGLGVAGVALAAVLAEAAGLALGVAALARLGSRPWSVERRALLDGAAIRRTLSINGNIMVRSAALIAAFGAFTALSARAGDLVLAANAVLENMFLIGGYFLDGFATAAETLCGQALGARDENGFRRAVRLSLLWCLGFGLVVSALFLVTGEAFIDLVTTNGDVRALARDYLVFAALAPLAGAAAFAFDGIYVGATWTRALRDLMLAALAAFGLALLILQGFGNTGLWLALLAFLGARAAGQALLYPRLAAATFGRPRSAQ